MTGSRDKIVYLVGEDWFFCSHFLPMGRAAKAAGFEVVILTRPGERRDHLEREGFRLVTLDFARNDLNPLRKLATVARVASVLRAEQPAVLHNIALGYALVGTLAGRRAGVPVIVNAITGLGYLRVATSRAHARHAGCAVERSRAGLQHQPRADALREPRRPGARHCRTLDGGGTQHPRAGRGRRHRPLRCPCRAHEAACPRSARRSSSLAEGAGRRRRGPALASRARGGLRADARRPLRPRQPEGRARDAASGLGRRAGDHLARLLVRRAGDMGPMPTSPSRRRVAGRVCLERSSRRRPADGRSS